MFSSRGETFVFVGLLTLLVVWETVMRLSLLVFAYTWQKSAAWLVDLS